MVGESLSAEREREERERERDLRIEHGIHGTFHLVPLILKKSG